MYKNILVMKRLNLETRFIFSFLKLQKSSLSNNVIAESRNLFEVYENNPHWLGVYERHPVVKQKFAKQDLKYIIEEESVKQISLSLPELIDTQSSKWSETSKRVGAIGTKLGGSTLWTKDGKRHYVTLVQIRDCHVIDVQISREDGGTDRVTQLILGAHEMNDEGYMANLSRAKVQWWDNLGLPPRKYWAAFKVTKDALLLPGTEVTASHFMPGQLLNVQGKTIRRGIQGVMRRWGMKGQPASHGQSKTHRKMGATGGGQDPGRIFPGKKMAGGMGGKFKTTPPVQLMRINTKYNILYIKGPLPGEIGSFLKLRDATNRKFPKEAPFFPTHFQDIDEQLQDDLCAENVFSFNEPSIKFPPYK